MREERLARKEADDADAPAAPEAEAADTSHIASQVTKLSEKYQNDSLQTCCSYFCAHTHSAGAHNAAPLTLVCFVAGFKYEI